MVTYTGNFTLPDHLVHSDGTNVYALGRDPEHVYDAVYSLLEHIGYRQVMPEELWENIPVYKNLAVAIDQRVNRLFRYPTIVSSASYGGGSYSHAQARKETWQRKNLAYRREGVSTGHMYQSLVLEDGFSNVFGQKFKDAFAQNDGVYANKYWLCVDNQMVRDAGVEWVKNWGSHSSRLNLTHISASIPDGSFRVYDDCDGVPIDNWTDRQIRYARYIHDQMHLDTNYNGVDFSNKGLFIQAYGHTAFPPQQQHFFQVDAQGDILLDAGGNPIPIGDSLGVQVMKGYTQNYGYDAVYQAYKDAGATLLLPYIYGSVFTGSKTSSTADH